MCMEYYKINTDACLEKRSIYLSSSVYALYEQNLNKYILQKKTYKTEFTLVLAPVM